ncbi:MAG: hydrogenase maturation nickel metallochaperone HypA [Coriobacteriales bacterium]|jgi:hydrogenase nickel incorporation protein HypA/HybF|nr:hydrogenase maturation nickel metallochaperone HypA [Coriobacteriales bacterium]
MHEFSLMAGVLDAVNDTAREHGARQVLVISLVIGEMAEVVPEALEFAFEALSADTISAGAQLMITFVHPRSRCTACGNEFEHDRFHWFCSNCGSLATELLAGRELYLQSIEVEDDPESKLSHVY